MAQHQVGAHISPLLLFGRLTVVLELSMVGKAMGPLEELHQSGGPVSDEQLQDLALLRDKWKTLPDVLDARVGADQFILIHPFSLVQTAGNYAMEINTYVHAVTKVAWVVCVEPAAFEPAY